ncbi:MAG: glutamyl-tRNA synthetase [Actinomycetota bacterium]|nr:glutamyl-tRNA synthetase [Actinomycetota bacterium]
MTDSAVRVRFCPSPTGNPHVGMVRTALFNWAYARHTGGTFVFRIEDTDSARDSEESYEALLAALRWLGLDWDEGPEVGGDYGPYRQSQRLAVYDDVAARLRESGSAYDCYCSTEELDARRERAMAEKRAPGYDGHCRALSEAQIAAYREEGRRPVLRFRMPDRDITWDDLVRGPITFAADQVPDFVVVRANGEPLYTLVNPVDDALMRVTHVLRGEDLLSSTPRQIALYEALAELGVSDGTTPRFGHLPYVMGEGNKKLSKRDPESSLQWYRDEGYLPEALLNYLALLGWSMGEDREFFGKDEMAAAFSLERVSPNPARFDLKKCTAINGDWIRALDPADLAQRIVPFLVRAGVVSEPLSDRQQATLAAAVPLVQERLETLAQAAGMLGFLLVPEGSFVRDPADVASTLNDDARPVIDAAIGSLESVDEWRAEPIEAALRAGLIDGLGLKPKVAFGPVRVAVSGRRVSPPLFESLEILGRETTLARLRSAL